MMSEALAQVRACRQKQRAVALTLVAMASVQIGAGVSTWLFDRLTPAGAAWLRLLWAAVVLLAVARPSLRGRSRADVLAVVYLGGVSGLLTLLYFEAVARIPLGTATALEFLGPLGVAVVGLRLGSGRWLNLAWPLLAVAGVLALTRPWTGAVDLVGVAYALGAAAGWAGYILLTQRVGHRFTGLSGLALSMTAATLVVTPLSPVGAVLGALDARVLLVSLGAALLLPILPYACEMLALRRLHSSSFGTLMSLEPAIGTIVGLVLLAQVPNGWQLAGVALVVIAGVGAIRADDHATNGPTAGELPATPGLASDDDPWRSRTVR
jgi:inner membrane transporter RhtA